MQRIRLELTMDQLSVLDDMVSYAGDQGMILDPTSSSYEDDKHYFHIGRQVRVKVHDLYDRVGQRELGE